ncbi:EAL domain-containing protein [Vibrio kyushuensis]|uniref:bifunctional diguanylate cyclase/phosphodiesterase n=1 Tax=Vibrio kyushuensis TaxID=2910249 RepID=UPI003D0D3635
MTQITLRTAVVVPFILIFLIAMSSIIFVQKYSYEEMVEQVSDKHLTSLTTNVVQKLNYYLEEPFQATLSISHNIGQNQLYTKGSLESIEQYILSSFESLYQPVSQLGVISFGSEASEYIGFRKEANNDFSLMLKDSRSNGKLTIYQGREISEQTRAVIENYDPKVRPWYTPVSSSKRPAWSTIYTDADERQAITISALAPVFEDEKFIGVVANDIKLHTFNAFLNELKQQTKATIYIFDNDHQLVTHSSSKSVVSWGTPITDKGDRLLAIESANPIIQAMAVYIQPLAFPIQSRLYKFDSIIGGERYFSQVTPYTDQHGLEWYIGVSISEPDLLGALPNNQRLSWSVGIVVSIIGIAIGLVAFNRVTKPISATAQSARNLAKGNWNSSMPNLGYVYEINMLVKAFNEMTNNLKSSFDALRHQLTYDSLTQLYSRGGLLEASVKLNAKQTGSLYLVGIDRFREINDSLGHQQADKLLVVAATRLRDTLPNHYLIARGSDEFAIYAPGVAEHEEVTLLTNRLLQAFASPFSMKSDKLIVNVSIGVVNTSPDKEMTVWLRNSSIALSKAKQDKTRTSVYSPEMAEVSRNRTKMLANISAAIEKQEFVPFYQPIIDLETGKILGAEALARWVSKQGLISPLEFIPLAEDNGFISDIGHQVLLKACTDTASAIHSGQWAKDFILHVNLSVEQLAKDEFIDDVKDILASTQLNAKNLTLEITESRIVDNDPMIMKNMFALKDLGISIAIDDFGTGYSSLAYLHKLPFDCLKIDRSFVCELEPENLDNSIVAAIVNITKGFKVNLVAEGVETQQQAELLRKLQCPQAQGFLYSRPVPFEEWPTHLVNMK